MHAYGVCPLPPGAAAPLGCVTLFVIWKCCCFVLCAQGILRVRGRGYYYPRRALRVLETPDGRLSKAVNLPFSEVGWSSLIPAVQKQKQHLTANSPGSL